MNRLYLYPSLQYRLLNPIDFKCGDANPSKHVKLPQLFFSDSVSATTSSLPGSPRTWRTSPTKGCHGANAWSHQPHATATYTLCFPVQWKLHLHTSQFDNLIIQKVNKNMHKSKLVSSSSQNFKVRISNPKYSLKQNLYINIYLEPKWGPLFCLEFRPSVGRFNPQNKGQKGPFSVYLSRHPRNVLPFHWIHPGGVGPLETVRSIPWETKRTRVRSKPHLDKDSERTLQVGGLRAPDEILVG